MNVSVTIVATEKQQVLDTIIYYYKILRRMKRSYETFIFVVFTILN
jgi:hypothetical protein